MSLDRSLGFIYFFYFLFYYFGQKSRSSCDIHHYIDHDAPRLSKLLHKHFSSNLLGITVIPRKIGDNGYAKCWGKTCQVHYGPWDWKTRAAVRSGLLTVVKTGTTIFSYFGNVTASLFALTIVRKFTPR